MSDEQHHTESLFSYGTLRQEEVQLATFGRRLAGRPDALVGTLCRSFRCRTEVLLRKNGAHQRTLNSPAALSDVVEGVACP
jgi:hypothetical protein